jgi:hypothetical protein
MTSSTTSLISTKITTTEKPPISSPIDEKLRLLTLIFKKGVRFGFISDAEFSPKIHGMEMCESLTGPKTFKVSLNTLYLLQEKDVDCFLSQKPEHQKTIYTFLLQKKGEILETAAKDLIKWFNDNQPSYCEKVEITTDNIISAKEILTMRAIGQLSAMKRFAITHELAHAHELCGYASLGDFDPHALNFIKPHQYEETRADLTAARDMDAHGVGSAYFLTRSMFAIQPKADDSHPSDVNRAKAIELDYIMEKIKKEKIEF